MRTPSGFAVGSEVIVRWRQADSDVSTPRAEIDDRYLPSTVWKGGGVASGRLLPSPEVPRKNSCDQDHILGWAISTSALARLDEARG